MISVADVATFVWAFVPPALALVATVLAIWVAYRILEPRSHLGEGHLMRLQVIHLSIVIVGVLAIVLTLPVRDQLRGQLLGFLGIVLSAALALSSTTLLGNALAGFMLRAIRGFRMGDFIRVGDHFGRVSERGLFHTEIQTEDRDLTTLPNLFLVTNPVSTIRSSGTIISATVSLGYDAPRDRVEALLLEAAGEAGLAEPFVHVMELGDFSVTYRIAGLLTEVGTLLSTRSRLRSLAMDTLHRGGIEIVSPTFMSQRVFPADRRFIPEDAAREAPPHAHGEPEKTVFDKAQDAETLGQMRARHGELGQEIADLKAAMKEAGDDAERERLKGDLGHRTRHRERLESRIAAGKEKIEGPAKSPREGTRPARTRRKPKSA